MKIIIAPAKKMLVDTDSFDVLGMPQFLDETEAILATMRKLSYDEAQAMWRTGDKLTQNNYDWLQQLDLKAHLTPALIAYSGIQYQYMAPDVFTLSALDYVQANLRILSGFYGILRPFDGVVPYRLEMQSQLSVAGFKDLYAFWGRRLYSALAFETGPVVNLSSKEYTDAITPYLKPADQLINIVFGSIIDGKVKTRATHAKMARGAMVRYMAENNVTTIEALQAFDHPHFKFDSKRSTRNELVFLEEPKAYHSKKI